MSPLHIRDGGGENSGYAITRWKNANIKQTLSEKGDRWRKEEKGKWEWRVESGEEREIGCKCGE